MLSAILDGRDVTTLLLASTTATGDDSAASPGRADSAPSITGSVHLTMPLSAWLWLTDRPGEVAGSGTADADTCRDLAGRLAAYSATKWCLTLTDPDGRAVAHACARNGPPRPPGPPGPPRATGPPRSTGPPGSTRPARSDRSPGCRPIARTRRTSRRHHRLASPPAARVPPGRVLHPPPADTRLPAAALAAPPHHHPSADLRRARLPAPRPPMRPRPHHPLPPRRPHLRMRPSPAVPPRSPRQASPRLAPRPARARRHDLDPAQRPYLHHPPRPLPHLGRIATAAIRARLRADVVAQPGVRAVECGPGRGAGADQLPPGPLVERDRRSRVVDHLQHRAQAAGHGLGRRHRQQFPAQTGAAHGRIHEQPDDLGQLTDGPPGRLEQSRVRVALGQADLADDGALMLGHPGRDQAVRGEPARRVGGPAVRVAAAVVNAAQDRDTGIEVARPAGANRHNR